MSRNGWVNRVRISEMLAPYRTDSKVGRRDTDIGGRYATGTNRAEKNVITQLKIGRAGKKLKTKGVSKEFRWIVLDWTYN
jgi:hypothetical protein